VTPSDNNKRVYDAPRNLAEAGSPQSLIGTMADEIKQEEQYDQDMEDDHLFGDIDQSSSIRFKNIARGQQNTIPSTNQPIFIDYTETD
jgi:hypothetical protein